MRNNKWRSFLPIELPIIKPCNYLGMSIKSCAHVLCSKYTQSIYKSNKFIINFAIQ